MAPTHHEKKMTTPFQKPGTPIFPLHPYDEDPNWTKGAACKGSTELFYPERGDNITVRKAKLICSTCPMQKKCLEYALYHNEHNGIWGGTTDRERSRIKRQHKYDSEPHGTYTGWMMHYRRKEQPCEPCRTAKNIYQNANKKKNRQPNEPVND